MTRPTTFMMASALSAALTACTTTAAAPPSPAGSGGGSAAQAAAPSTAADLQRKIARFAPTELTADLGALADTERQALAAMLRAAQIMDGLFLRQVWAGNEGVLFQLLRDPSPKGQARLH